MFDYDGRSGFNRVFRLPNAGVGIIFDINIAGIGKRREFVKVKKKNED